MDKRWIQIEEVYHEELRQAWQALLMDASSDFPEGKVVSIVVRDSVMDCEIKAIQLFRETDVRTSISETQSSGESDMGEQPKRMTVSEFREQGYLQELNRLFLHPLGMALEVIVDEDTGEEHFGGVWDYRDDLEGIRFAKGAGSRKKALAIRGEMDKAKSNRIQTLGYFIQPIDDLADDRE